MVLRKDKITQREKTLAKVASYVEKKGMKIYSPKGYFYELKEIHEADCIRFVELTPECIRQGFWLELPEDLPRQKIYEAFIRVMPELGKFKRK